MQATLTVNTREWWEDKTRKYLKASDLRNRKEETEVLAKHCIGSVLDIGCCFGMLSSYLKTEQRYLGIDISEHAINAARHYFPGRVFVHGDFLDLAPFLGKFDTVFSSQFVEHFCDPRQPIAWMRMLASYRIVISVPRGEPTEDQKEHEGHLSWWKDAKAFNDFISESRVFDVDGIDHASFSFEELQGLEHHICGVITWE